MTDRVLLNNSQQDPIGEIFSIYTARPGRPILLTENKRDESVYKAAFKDSCYISTIKRFCNSDGREKVISFLKEINSNAKNWTSKAKIRGLIDKDLDLSDDQLKIHEDNNIFTTDFSEMEMYGFLNENFSLFLEADLPMEYEFDYSEVISIILKISSPLGAIRLIAHNPRVFFEKLGGGSIKFHYEKFCFKTTGKKAAIKEIDDVDQADIINETLIEIKKPQYGTDINKVFENLPELLRFTIDNYDQKYLVNSKMFEACLCRYFLSPGRIKNNKGVRSLILSDNFFIKDARKFIISNPSVIIGSQLGNKITNLIDQ